MQKPNYITIPKVCTAKKLASIYELKSRENFFLNLAISFNEKNRIKGIITLGDLRRIIIKFGKNANVNKHLNTSPIVVMDKDLNNKIRSFLEKKN